MIYRKIKVIEFRDLVKGLANDSAITIINENYALASTPEIRMQPEWSPRLHFIPLRITIITESNKL